MSFFACLQCYLKNLMGMLDSAYSKYIFAHDSYGTLIMLTAQLTHKNLKHSGHEKRFKIHLRIIGLFKIQNTNNNGVTKQNIVRK
jgi:hypothetical protein